MKTKAEAFEFAKSSAETAVDELGGTDYSDPVGAFEDNVIDTLNGYGLHEYVLDAVAHYKEQVAVAKSKVEARRAKFGW